MSSITRRRGGAPAPPRGLFMDGVWHCDCNPRQPANHFEVKKPGPNQGKWFRTCQKQQNDRSRCKFFLWDSDAHPREAAALASNSRTESSHAKTPPKRISSPCPPPTTKSMVGRASRKRDRAFSIERDDDYGFDVTEGPFKDELDRIVAAVETPRKATKTSEIATPSISRMLPWNREKSIGLQTPESASTLQANSSLSLGKQLFTSTPSTDTPNHNGTPSSPLYETPTPLRFKDMVVNDLVSDVFSLLQSGSIKLGATPQHDLKDLLSKHAKVAEGLKRGRDVARFTIKARDAKITELSHRISTLEAELEAEKALVKHLQWQAEAVDAVRGS